MGQHRRCYGHRNLTMLGSKTSPRSTAAIRFNLSPKPRQNPVRNADGCRSDGPSAICAPGPKRRDARQERGCTLNPWDAGRRALGEGWYRCNGIGPGYAAAPSTAASRPMVSGSAVAIRQVGQDAAPPGLLTFGGNSVVDRTRSALQAPPTGLSGSSQQSCIRPLFLPLKRRRLWQPQTRHRREPACSWSHSSPCCHIVPAQRNISSWDAAA